MHSTSVRQSPSFKSYPRVFYTYFYNHVRRLRLKKTIISIELSRSSNGYFEPLLIQIQMAVSEVKRPLHNRFIIKTTTVQIYNGYTVRNDHSTTDNGKSVRLDVTAVM